MTDWTGVRVLALGSPHGDDQVAWRVADNLMRDSELADIVFKLTSPVELVDHLQPEQRAIILDACRSGAPPGTVVRVDADELSRFPTGRLSSHGGSLLDALRLGDVLGRRAESVVVLAVEVESCAPAAEMTETGRQSVRALEAGVRAELARWAVDSVSGSSCDCEISAFPRGAARGL